MCMGMYVHVFWRARSAVCDQYVRVCAWAFNYSRASACVSASAIYIYIYIYIYISISICIIVNYLAGGCAPETGHLAESMLAVSRHGVSWPAGGLLERSWWVSGVKI